MERFDRRRIRMMRHHPWSRGLAVLALAIWSGIAAADGIKVELNKLEPNADACRAYLIFANAGPAIEALQLHLVLFDQSEVISRSIVVDTGPLRAAKTTVKLVDIPGLACTDIRRMLLNDVSECRDAAGTHKDCIERLTLSSRGEVELVK
jgi:hypothetical protein